VTGCVQPAEDGLRFDDEKKDTSYSLAAGDVSLKAGQRVQLQGKKSKSTSGGQNVCCQEAGEGSRIVQYGIAGSTSTNTMTMRLMSLGNGFFLG